MSRLLLVLLASACLLALTAASASANSSQMSIMMDDDLLLYRGDQVRDDTMTRMKQLGVDAVRVTVLWEVVADRAKDTRARRRRFEDADPRTYPKGNWDRYDRLVRAGETLGIKVFFNITGPGPSWVHKKAPRRHAKLQRSWKPKPKKFHEFVKALGIRYSGFYRDENDGAKLLPRVNMWSLWNEPNQRGWLAPQYQKGRPFSPRLYRELWYQGRAALEETGHTLTDAQGRIKDLIFAGETAPLGSNGSNEGSPMRPKKFIRELMCVDAKLRIFKRSAAKRRGCDLFKKLQTFKHTAWAHHPYTKDLQPTQRDRHKDSITMANIDELTALLDQIGERTGRAPKFNLTVLTEFGYESNPPDPYAETNLQQQAEYINVGDYLAYLSPRVFGNTQFLLRDVAPVKGKRRKAKWFTYQSGLYFVDGRDKPAAAAYKFPFHLVASGIDSVGATVNEFWGQARFFPNGIKTTVYIQYKIFGGTEWETVSDPIEVTNAQNFWTGRAAVRGQGTWRAVWVNPYTFEAVISREITAG